MQFLFSLFIAIFVVVAPLSAQAFYLDMGEKISITEDLKDDAYLIASETRISQPQSESVAILSENVVLNGELSDDAMIIADHVIVDTTISGDLAILATRVDIKREAVIEGNVFLAARSVKNMGMIQGDARVYANTLVMLPPAKIDGDLHVTAEAVADFDYSNMVGGSISFIDSLFENISGRDPATDMTLLAYRYLSLLFASLCVFYLLPRFVTDMEYLVREKIGKCLLQGALILFLGWIPAAIIAFISIPIALWSFATWFLLGLFLDKLLISVFVGSTIINRYQLNAAWQIIGVNALTTATVLAIFIFTPFSFLLQVGLYLPILGASLIIVRSLLTNYARGNIVMK